MIFRPDIPFDPLLVFRHKQINLAIPERSSLKPRLPRVGTGQELPLGHRNLHPTRTA